MAKMSQEMYGASGKVGNKVYYRSASGKTVAREKTTPKNPRTLAQTLQRVIISQVGLMYKAFKEICDHSFEGYTMGAQCANRFRKLNTDYFRRRASEINQAGQSLDQLFNFRPIGDSRFVPSAAIIAQGSLPEIFASVGSDALGLVTGKIAVVTENTYQGVCNALRLQRGDQLTFITVSKYNGTYFMEKARVILDPRNSDGSGAAMSTALIDSNGAIQNPSFKNQGNVYLNFGAGGLEFIAEPMNGSVVVAAAVIASRKNGDSWLRSNSTLVISETGIGSDLCSLLAAMDESYGNAPIDLENEAYLNNAGTGGAQGSGDNTGGGSFDPTTPTYSNSAVINGVSQNIAGGSVSVTGPLTSVSIAGTNLSEVTTCMKNGALTLLPTKTASALNWSGLNVAAPATVGVYKNESDATPWFTINVVADGGGGGGNNSPGGDE